MSTVESLKEDQDVAKAIAVMSGVAVRKSLEAAGKSFDEFKADIEKRAADLFTARPVLEVIVKEGDEPKKLSTRAADALPRLIVNAKLQLNSMLVGPAGCGKTTAAFQLSEALGVQFGSVCLTAGASETWLFGRQTPTGFVEGAFSKIYREGGVFLADEMDAADANLLLSINTALSHDSMLNPMSGEVIKKHKNFTFIGAANTNGKGSTHTYTGRSRLDAATLDRMVIINVDYDKELEKELCPDSHLFGFLQKTRQALRNEGYDEFISTRAFIVCYKQLQAGVPKAQIKDSLVSNWGDAAKSTAESNFREWVRSTQGQQATKPPEGLFARVVQRQIEGRKVIPAVWK